MKKKIIVSVVCVLVLAVLFLPIPMGVLEDGGTRVYRAATYTLVRWNVLVDSPMEESAGETIYKNTSVFWLPDSTKSIDDLWEMEKQNHLAQ